MTQSGKPATITDSSTRSCTISVVWQTSSCSGKIGRRYDRECLSCVGATQAAVTRVRRRRAFIRSNCTKLARTAFGLCRIFNPPFAIYERLSAIALGYRFVTDGRAGRFDTFFTFLTNLESVQRPCDLDNIERKSFGSDLVGTDRDFLITVRLGIRSLWSYRRNQGEDTKFTVRYWHLFARRARRQVHRGQWFC